MPKVPFVKARSVILKPPWIPPFQARFDEILSEPAVIDLNWRFREALSSKVFRKRRLSVLEQRFSALDNRKHLIGSELRYLYQVAREIAVIRQLGTPEASEPLLRELLSGEFLHRLGEGSPGWYFTGDRALARPESSPETLLDPEKLGELGKLFSEALRAGNLLSPKEHSGGRVWLRLENSAQLPFSLLLLMYLVERGEADIGLHADPRFLMPGLYEEFLRRAQRIVGKSLEVLPVREFRGETSAVPSSDRIRSLSRELGRRAGHADFCLDWIPATFTPRGTLDCRSFERALAPFRKAGIRPHAIVWLSFPTDDRQEAFAHSVLDCLLRHQWNLRTVRLETMPLDSTNGSASQQAVEMLRIQLEAEAANSDLSYMGRQCAPLLSPEGRTKLKARVPVVLRSHHCLDVLSRGEPPLFGRSIGFNWDAKIPADLPSEAAPRPLRWLFFPGSPIVLSPDRHRTMLKVVQLFRKPARFLPFVQGQAAMGRAINKLRNDGILVSEREPVRKEPLRLLNRKGLVSLVGIGPEEEGAISVSAQRAIESAEEIWMQDLGTPGFERPIVRKAREKIRRVVNMSGHYCAPNSSRILFYSFIARRLLHLSRQGRRITYLFSGNPDVWVRTCTVLKEATLKEDVDLRIVCSMSFIDVMYRPTPLSLRDNLQIRLAGVTNPDISPEVDCIVGQLGDTGFTGGPRGERTLALQETLLRWYPAEHPVFLVGNHTETGAEKSVRIPLHRLAEEAGRLGTEWFFSLLIPSLSHGRRLTELASGAPPFGQGILFSPTA